MTTSNFVVARVTLEEIIEVRRLAVSTGFPEDKVEDRRDGAYVRHFVIRHADERKGKDILAGCTIGIGEHEKSAAFELYSVTINSRFVRWRKISGRDYEWPLLHEAMKILLEKYSSIRTFFNDVPVGVVVHYKWHGWETYGKEFEKSGKKYVRVVKEFPPDDAKLKKK